MTPAWQAKITVRLFEQSDQHAARQLILEGLGEHFGWIDETLNPDLDDIAASFVDGVFVLALVDGAIAATGGLHLQHDGTANIVRMSTASAHRRRGLGRAAMARLIDVACSAGCHRVTLVTNSDWDDAVGFYRASHFEELLRPETGIAFAFTL